MTERPDKYFPYRFGQSLWSTSASAGATRRSARSSNVDHARRRARVPAAARPDARRAERRVARGGQRQVPAAGGDTGSAAHVCAAAAHRDEGAAARSSWRRRCRAMASRIAFLSNGRPEAWASCSSTSGSATPGPASASSASSRARPIRTSRSCGFSTRRARSRTTGGRLRSPRSAKGKDVLYLMDVANGERARPSRSPDRRGDQARSGRPTTSSWRSAARAAASATSTSSTPTARTFAS